jgi:GNAT superfamily N-acetyltransferase
MTHLTHGWEPELDADDSLLRRFTLASAERSEAMTRAIDGRVRRTDTYSAADPDSPIMFENAIVLLQPPAYIDLEAELAEALAWYPPDRHVVLFSPFPTPDLEPMGLSPVGHPPLMYRPAGGTAPPLPDGLSIRRVTTGDDLALFVTTIVDAYPMPGGESSALADPRVLEPALHFFVGEIDGAVVATAGVRVAHGLNDVEWISTRAEHRRRGIGAALTWAATLADPELPAVLIASDDGQPVYEAMGYVRIMRLTLWHRPPVA